MTVEAREKLIKALEEYASMINPDNKVVIFVVADDYGTNISSNNPRIASTLCRAAADLFDRPTPNTVTRDYSHTKVN